MPSIDKPSDCACAARYLWTGVKRLLEGHTPVLTHNHLEEGSNTFVVTGDGGQIRLTIPGYKPCGKLDSSTMVGIVEVSLITPDDDVSGVPMLAELFSSIDITGIVAYITKIIGYTSVVPEQDMSTAGGAECAVLKHYGECDGNVWCRCPSCIHIQQPIEDLPLLARLQYALHCGSVMSLELELVLATHHPHLALQPDPAVLPDPEVSSVRGDSLWKRLVIAMMEPLNIGLEPTPAAIAFENVLAVAHRRELLHIVHTSA